jgi:hypothetical protein
MRGWAQEASIFPTHAVTLMIFFASSAAAQERVPESRGLSVMDVDDTPNEAEQPTMREFLAGWIRRPEVRWWAEQNGFKLGTAEPLDPESALGREVAAGRYPETLLTNGMLYSMSPDDIRAFRLANAQTQMNPEKNVLRAIGQALKPKRIVEVEFIVSAGVKPKTRTVLLEERKPWYGTDYPGSVRGVNTETGREQYIPPELVASKSYPAGKQKRPSLVELINKMSARGTSKREGHDLVDASQNQPDREPK